MKNDIIIVENCHIETAKEILTEYCHTFDIKKISFKLFDKNDKTIIELDKPMKNDEFFMLQNQFLYKYVSAVGFTKGQYAAVKNKDIMVYTTQKTDEMFYFVTDANECYQIDIEENITRIDGTVKYQSYDNLELNNPVIFTYSKDEYLKIQQDKEYNSLKKRFTFLAAIIFCFYAYFSFFFDNTKINKFNDLLAVLLLSAWFLADCALVKFNRYFLYSLIFCLSLTSMLIITYYKSTTVNLFILVPAGVLFLQKIVVLLYQKIKKQIYFEKAKNPLISMLSYFIIFAIIMTVVFIKKIN